MSFKIAICSFPKISIYGKRENNFKIFFITKNKINRLKCDDKN